MEARKHRHGFVVGIFVMLAIVIFVLAVLTLGSERKAFGRKCYIRLEFKEVSGLKEGNNVWFDGVKIGTVRNIELLAPSRVQVTLSVERKAQSFIKQDATAKIGSDGLLGNKIVIIEGGSVQAAGIDNNGYLPVQKDTLSNEDMLATLQMSNKNLLEITGNIRDVSRQIKDGKGTMAALVNDSGMASDLRVALVNFRVLSADGRRAVANIEGLTARANDKRSSLNRLLVDTTLYDSVRIAVIELKSVIDRANSFAAQLSPLSAGLAQAGGRLLDTTSVAGLILNDESTANDVRVIIQHLKNSGIKLEEDLEAVRHNFLLKGYFRKNKRKP